MYADTTLYDSQYLCNLLKTRLTDMYIQTFFHNLSVDSGKLRFYRKCKTEYCIERYLELVNFEQRSAISKIRLSAHPLEIEKGRYTKTPVFERICKYCSSNAVEDESHFISSCPRNDDKRSTLFTEAAKIFSYFPSITDEERTILLLKSKNPQIIDEVGKFVFHCLQRRSQTQPS